MKQGKSNNVCILFFVFVIGFTISAGAQEFRGFYSSNNDVRNNAPSSRYYKSGHSSHKNSSYVPLNSYASDYGSSLNYFDGSVYQPLDENPGTYPVTGLTINIFSPVYMPAGGTPDYNYYTKNSGYHSYDRNSGYNSYNRNSDYSYYDRGYYPNNNKIPAGTKTVTIDGDRFYEMNGNYYRADRYNNAGNANYKTSRQDDKNYYIAEDQRTGNGVYIPASAESGNSNYFDKNARSVYTDKRQLDNTISNLQQQQKALQDENDELKRQQNEQQANEIEQAKSRQKLKEQNDAAELQEAKKDDMRWQEANRNISPAPDVFYSDLKIGDTVDQVPQNSKVITIDGKKTYVSPRNTYFQKQKNGRFTVVGMEGK